MSRRKYDWPVFGDLPVGARFRFNFTNGLGAMRLSDKVFVKVSPRKYRPETGTTYAHYRTRVGSAVQILGNE